MRSMIHTSASLLFKVGYENGVEKVIGFAKGLSYTVSQGQKVTYVVDSAVPAEIAQGAGASFVKGSITLYLPKGTTVESMGLVPHRTDTEGNSIMGLSKYLHFHIYDRSTLNKIFSAEWCKVGTYSVSVVARGVVEVNLQFDGILATPGSSL